MGKKKKLIRFKQISEMPCVIEPTMDMCLNDAFPLKGKWHKEFFKNDNPIVLELGCGKGEYSVQLGKKYPNKNYIGVDIKGARIWYGANEVEEEGLENIGFLRTRIDFITSFFGKDEIDEIWLTFSDPQPRKARKRLSSPLFINRYRQFLKQGGIVHVKTDSDLLFEYTLEQVEENNYKLLESTWNLYGEHVQDLDNDTRENLSIKTHYEDLFSQKGFDIKYCKFVI